MKNARVEGRVHLGDGATGMCKISDFECGTVVVEWDGGSAQLNEDRHGYTCPRFAAEQWAKTMAAANLMAAAPDLLDALEDVIKSAQANCGESLANAITAGQDAIAKAKGGE